jgi:hypothetical protein
MVYDPAKFLAGSQVRIEPRGVLEEFRKKWTLHNPLSDDQLPFAGVVAAVDRSFMYHGGYVLYELKGIPGVWHEQFLRQATELEKGSYR